jgi:hypothetical protein
MKDITTIGLVAFFGYLVFRKSVPPTIVLPKAIENVNKIR